MRRKLEAVRKQTDKSKAKEKREQNKLLSMPAASNYKVVVEVDEHQRRISGND